MTTWPVFISKAVINYRLDPLLTDTQTPHQIWCEWNHSTPVEEEQEGGIDQRVHKKHHTFYHKHAKHQIGKTEIFVLFCEFLINSWDRRFWSLLKPKANVSLRNAINMCGLKMEKRSERVAKSVFFSLFWFTNLPNFLFRDSAISKPAVPYFWGCGGARRWDFKKSSFF